MSLVRSAARAAGWALFDDRRLVARRRPRSGAAVAQLGAVARQAGTPVSLHGTGGAWLVAGETADADRLRRAVLHSLDRKVCNTLNVCCLPAGAADLVGGRRSTRLARRPTGAARAPRLHVESARRDAVPDELFSTKVEVRRADGVHVELLATELDADDLGREWEWEDVAGAVARRDRRRRHGRRPVQPPQPALRRQPRRAPTPPSTSASTPPSTPRSSATASPAGSTASTPLDTPELGLSNWQGGRLLGRGGVLSGDSVHTIRYRATVTDPDLHR